MISLCSWSKVEPSLLALKGANPMDSSSGKNCVGWVAKAESKNRFDARNNVCQ